MNQQGLHGVASSRIISLCVKDNLDSLIDVCRFIQVYVTNAISVSKNRNRLGALLDRLDEFITSTWDDQVNVTVQLQKIGNFISSRHKTHSVTASIFVQGLAHQCHESLITVLCLFASLHQKTIGRGNCQGGNLRQGTWPRFENYHKNSNRNGLLY